MPQTVIESFSRTGLPAAGNAGRIVRVTDEPQNLWIDNGQQWFGINGDVFNVKAFGATGDGRTDDITAFESAILAMPPNGGRLIIPAPATSYFLSRSLHIFKPVILEGQGGGLPSTSKILLAAGASIIIDSFNSATPLPTLTVQGATGSTQYTYLVVPKNAQGTFAPSPAVSVTNGNAVLSATNSITITPPSMPGITSWNFYRTQSGGTPSSTGKIGTTTGAALIDTGLAGDGTTAPAVVGASGSILRSFAVFGTIPPTWAPSTAYAVGNVVKNIEFWGAFRQHIFVCVRAGTSGTTEPAWPFRGEPHGYTTEGTFVDEGVNRPRWQCVSSPGIWMKASSHIENVYVQDCPGDGVYVYGYTRGQKPIYTNSNRFKIESCLMQLNYGAGICIEGTDGQAGLTINNSMLNNWGGGLTDICDVGNTHIQDLAEGNSGPFFWGANLATSLFDAIGGGQKCFPSREKADAQQTATGNVYYYKAITPGTTGATEPNWPSTIGATVSDGTAVWTCIGVMPYGHPIAAVSARFTRRPSSTVTRKATSATANSTSTCRSSVPRAHIFDRPIPLGVHSVEISLVAHLFSAPLRSRKPAHLG